MDLFRRLRDLATAVNNQLEQIKARLLALESAGASSGTWGTITGTLSAQADLQAALNAKQAAGSYLTANQPITLSGDATGSGATAIAVTLSTVNSSPGTFGDATHSLTATVDAKGRITALASQLVTPAFASLTGKPTTVAGYGITDALTANQTITLSGDVTGSGSTAIAVSIGAHKVTRGMLVAATGATLLGATAAGDIADLTAAQAKTFLAIAQSDVSGLVTALAAKAQLAGGNALSGTQSIDLSSGFIYARGVNGFPELHVRPNSGFKGVVSFTENAVADRWSFGIKPSDANLYWSADGLLTNIKMTLTSAGNLTLTGTVAASNLSGTNTGDQFTSIAASTILGNNTGGAAAATALTAAQVKTLLAIGESDVANLTTDLAAKAPLANPQFTGVPYYQQPTPTAVNATATLTIAQLLTLIITTTSTTAVSLTLPTGTLTDAGILSGALAVNEAFEWYLINLGSSSGAVTLVAGTGHTIVGNAVVAIGTSARFLTRKTATNTFVTYRIA